MKKTMLFTILLSVFVLMLVGCGENEKFTGIMDDRLTRVDVQEINSDGNYGDFVMITDNESIELLRTKFEKVQWKTNVDPIMDGKEDLLVTLFFELDKNMPERLYEYRIWFNSDDTATIISNNEKEGYGKLDKENGEILKSTLLEQLKEKNPTSSDDWKVRNEYKVNDKVLFTVATEPNLSAGKPAGYVFSFTAPFETFKGKTIAIYAYHKKTGKKETAVPLKTITEPSPGYPSLNRFTANFTLPLSGLWKYEVVLNEQIYGDVVLNVNEPSS